MDLTPWLRDLYGRSDADPADVDESFLPDLSAPNLFESVVVSAQTSGFDFPLLALFGGALFGTRNTMAGDVYSPRWTAGRAAPDVWLWHHDEGYIWSYAAPSFPVLDGMLEALALHDRGDAPGALARWAALGADYSPPRDYDFGRLRNLLESAPRLGVRPPAIPAPDVFERAAWIVALLLGDGGVPPPASPEVLRRTLEGIRRLEALSAPDALYGLWCSYWLGEDAAAGALAGRLAGGPRLVADAARLVGELLAGRRTIGKVDLAAARVRLLAPAPDPYPPRVVAEPLVFVRDDDLAAAVEDEPSASRLVLPRSRPELRCGDVPLARHPDGRRALVLGTRDRPPAPGQIGGAYDHVLAEVDEAAGRLEVLVIVPGAVRRARYLDADHVLAFAPRVGLCVIERTPYGGVLSDLVPSARDDAGFAGDGRTLVVVGAGGVGVARCDAAGPRTVGGAALDLDRVSTAGGGAVVANAARRIAYRLEGLGAVPAGDAGRSVVFRRSFCPVVEIPVREGPAAVLSALTYRDIARQLPTGRCIVLRGVDPVQNRFEVVAADEQGLHPLTPPLAGGVLYYTPLGGDRVLVSIDARSAHLVDVAARTSERLLELPADLDHVEAAGPFLVGLADGSLRLYRDGKEVQRVEVGGDAAWAGGPLLGGRVVALESPTRGIVLLAAREAGLSLLGATDPTELSPANATIRVIDVPAGNGRLLATQGDLRREAVNLAGALAAGDDLGLGEELPTEPWRVRPIAVR